MRNRSVVETAAAGWRALRAWAWFPVAGAVVLAVFVVAPPGPLRVALTTVVSVGAAAAGAVVTRRGPGALRVVVAAVALFAFTDIVWNLMSALPGLRPYRDLTELAYLAALATSVVGTLRLLRLRVHGSDREGLVDGAVVATAVALVLWHQMVVPQASGGGWHVVAVGVFALLEAGIAAMAFRLLFTDAVRLPSIWLLFGAQVLLLAGSLSEAMLPVGLLGFGPLVEFLYTLSFLCAGTALLHPSAVSLGRPSSAPPQGVPLARLIVFGASLLVAPTLAYASVELTAPRAVEAAGGLLLIALVMWRLVALLVERERARGELGALADQQETVARLGHVALADRDLPRLLERTAAEVVRTLACEGCEVLGVRAGRVDGLPGPEVAVGDAGLLRAAAEAGRRWTDGERAFLQAVAHLLASAIERRRHEDEMHRLALHDPLTGLANRTLLGDRLRQAIAGARRDGGRVSVLFCDLDGFKRVNDTFGHAAGDAVLIALAARIREQVRATDTLARFAGDEFVIVLPDAADPAGLAGRVEAALRRPVTVRRGDGEAEARVGVSVGIATAAGVSADPDRLLHDADAAMYRHKHHRPVRAG